MIPMGLFGLLMMLALLWLLVSLIRTLARRGAAPEIDCSLQLLKEHLARGEINEAEFDRLHQKLLRHP